MPFDNDSYDVIINVESSHCYPSIPQFLSEVKRVLKPGGFFAWTDICPEKAINHYEDSFNNMGMKNIESYEITKNVLNALDKDTINETKNKIIKDETLSLIHI